MGDLAVAPDMPSEIFAVHAFLFVPLSSSCRAMPLYQTVCLQQQVLSSCSKKDATNTIARKWFTESLN